MPANTDPIFTMVPNSLPITLTAANLASDGSGTIPTLLTAGTFGTRVDQVVFRNAQLTQALSSNMIGKVFLSDASGLNWKLIGEVLLPATTRSATVIGATGTITFSPALTLKSGQLLGATISVRAGAQDDTSVLAYGGDF